MADLNRSGIITLTTDFGLDDAYVGMVKGVILNIFPRARLVDITHSITPQHIQQAGFLLFTAHRYFPDATVHMAVVDPGVGTSRRPIVVQANRQFLVGPDNGLFTDFLNDQARVYHLNRPQFFLEKVSHTFHARDIFAPVSAHLAKGVDPAELGALITDPVRIERPAPVANESRIVGTIIYVDRFGNLITNIRADQVSEDSIVRIMGKEIRGIALSYGDHPKGSLLAIIGSSGLLEIALACDSAALRLKAGIGQAVEVRKQKN